MKKTFLLKVLKLAESMGVILRLVDIGGGFPGWDGSEFIPEGSSFPQSLSLKDIADATNPLLSELFTGNTDVRFIAEPGRYFVEASHTLFTRIYTVRPIRLRGELFLNPKSVWPSTCCRLTCLYI